MFYSLTKLPDKTQLRSHVVGVSFEYQERVDYDGIPFLEKVKAHDLNAIVQASKDSTNIYKILDRFSLGDYSVLNKQKPIYADVVGMPQTLAEVHDLMLRCDSKFKQLDPELQSAFGSVAQFAAKVSDGSASKVINDFVKSKQPKEEKPE